MCVVKFLKHLGMCVINCLKHPGMCVINCLKHLGMCVINCLKHLGMCVINCLKCLMAGWNPKPGVESQAPTHVAPKPACMRPLLTHPYHACKAMAQKMAKRFKNFWEWEKFWRPGPLEEIFPTRKKLFPRKHKVAFWGGTRGTACERLFRKQRHH